MAIMNFNYNQAISQANQIDAVADEMQRVANNQMQTSIDSIAASWRGEASQQFITYCVQTQNDIKAQVKALRELSGRIREVARIIKEAEERALELQRQQAAAGSVSGGGSHGGGGGVF